VLIVLPLAMLLSACQVAAQFWGAGILTASDAEAGSGFARVAEEQIQGYQQAQKTEASALVWNYASEGSQQDDLQTAVRQMVESEEVLIFAGATSNDATMRAAALSNFFNVPMLIPSSVADNLLPSTNLWAFRLSAPGSAHAAYLFQNVLNKQALRPAVGEPLGVDRIAILYEQNTFGESAAVAAAKQAMQQELLIGVYAAFDPLNPDPNSLKSLVNQTRLESVDLVYLVSSDPGVAQRLVQEFQSQYSPESMPVLMAQSGGFASLSFLNSPQAGGVYILRQQINLENCPVTSGSLAEAQAYAAVYLMNYAVQESQPPSLPAKPALSLPQSLSEVDQLNSRREAVRDALKNASLDVPCLGAVAFDNTGQNKLVNFELAVVRDGRIQPLSSETFLDELRAR
jgi:ABC-type branched-subunit amino acid transport system substrate-binding protein